MPEYLWESPCGEILSTRRSMTEDTLHKSCPCCGLEGRRLYTSFAFHRETPGHFSPATGQYVPNPRAFKDQLTEASDRQSERTGIPHDYKPFDMREVKPPEGDK